jgi:hypothetical protein
VEAAAASERSVGRRRRRDGAAASGQRERRRGDDDQYEVLHHVTGHRVLGPLAHRWQQGDSDGRGSDQERAPVLPSA